MSIDVGLYTYLIAQSGVTTLVSTRIYPRQAPESATLPYIVHTRVSARRFPHVAGASGTVRARIQIDVYAATPDSADAVFAALRNVLDGFRHGSMGSEYVVSVNLDDERTDLSGPTDGADPGVYRLSSDWAVLFGESATAV